LEHFVIQEHKKRSLGELGWREMLQLQMLLQGSHISVGKLGAFTQLSGLSSGNGRVVSTTELRRNCRGIRNKVPQEEEQEEEEEVENSFMGGVVSNNKGRRRGRVSVSSSLSSRYLPVDVSPASEES
jgi:hypothetical protein